jgi:hypothetical protein
MFCDEKAAGNRQKDEKQSSSDEFIEDELNLAFGQRNVRTDINQSG